MAGATPITRTRFASRARRFAQPWTSLGGAAQGTSRDAAASDAASSDAASSHAATAALDIDGLSVDYGSFRAVDGVDLAVEPATICGIVGQNGSGKTTLFKGVLGLVAPAAGSVSICGKGCRQARKEGLIGYVPQSEDVDRDFPLSVEDVVMMGRYGFMNTFRRPRAIDRRHVRDALEMVGMSDLRKRQIGALSGGQRKRVFIARAIAQGAQVLLLDEPFAGVDKPSEAAITDLLHSLRDSGKSIVVSTHDLATLENLCDVVALMYRRICFMGTPQEAVRPENLALAFGQKEVEQ